MKKENNNTPLYKDSPLGKIPCDWEVNELGNISKITSSKRIMMEEYISSGIPFYRSKEIIEKINGKETQCEIYIPHTRYINILEKYGAPEENQILITAVGSLGLAYLIKESDLPFYFKDGNLIWLKDIKCNYININFLISYFKSFYFKKEIDETTYGSSQKALTIENLNNFKIPLPPLPEQKAISQVLSTADDAIHTTEKLIAQKELRKKWLMQQLLTGKKRLKGFDGEWKEVRLKDVTTNFSRRNKDLVDAKVYSVTNKSGFVLQSDHFEGKVAGEDLSNYKIIKKNEFAYNPARVNVGSLAYFEEEIGVISSLYVCFKTTKEVLDYFLLQFLQIDHTKHRIEALGEGGVRVYLWYDLFSKIKIKLPSIEEQTAIAQVLQVADKEIQLLKTKQEKLKEQKKGLMQQLLTGKRRLNYE